jgi:cold shock CspA family protein
VRSVNFGNQESRRRIAASSKVGEQGVIGKLTYWNHEKGFGFIARDQRRENNVFIHAVALPENTVPAVGDNIEFEIQVSDDGRKRAANASIVA